jgi:hypothetical protein
MSFLFIGIHILKTGSIIVDFLCKRVAVLGNQIGGDTDIGVDGRELAVNGTYVRNCRHLYNMVMCYNEDGKLY